MKKICTIITMLVLFVVSFNIVYAKDSKEKWNNKEIFDYIQFDYDYLTQNDEETSEKYFQEISKNDNVSENDLEEKYSFSGDIENTLLYIQDNYTILTNNMNDEEKEIFDKFLLKKALIYYYNILGDGFINLSLKDSFDSKISKPDESKATNSNVAALRLYSDGSQHTYGSSGLNVDVGCHSWISVSNLTGSAITVGGLSVPAYNTVTIGTWGNKSEHNGIWYNLEGNYYAGDYPSTTALMIKLIDSTELTTLSNAIKNSSNDTWSYTNNCSSFASRMWNLIATSQTVSAGLINTPKNLATNMLSGAGIQSTPVTTSVSIYYKGNNPVYSTAWN